MQSTRGRSANASITGVQSFRPELEFEAIKIVVLRENYLKRIKKNLITSKGKVDMGVIGIVDTLRDCSIECVDIIQTWEKTQVDYPEIVKPFMWNNVSIHIHTPCSSLSPSPRSHPETFTLQH